MGQSTRRHFTPEFKAQTVKLATEGGHPLSQVAADLGIRASLLRRWRRDHEDLAAPAPKMSRNGGARGWIGQNLSIRPPAAPG
jgi:transposase-like protein